jgi:hypothetical protein
MHSNFVMIGRILTYLLTRSIICDTKQITLLMQYAQMYQFQYLQFSLFHLAQACLKRWVISTAFQTDPIHQNKVLTLNHM